MKTLLVCIYLIAATIFTTGAYASDLEKLYPQQLKEARNLYQLAHRFLKCPWSLPAGETLTPEMIKNPLRQQMHYKFRRLLGLAIDAGFDLSKLEEFGLEKEGAGYVIDNRKHPQWLSLSDLFRSLTYPQAMKFAARPLKEKGMSQQDIEVLTAYINLYDPNVMALTAEQALVAPYSTLPDNKQEIPEVSQLVRLKEAIRKSDANIWDQWSVDLLEQLSLHKQRILIDYLQQKWSFTAMAPQPVTLEYLNLYQQELVSGEQMKILNNVLSKVQQQSSKEAAQ